MRRIHAVVTLSCLLLALLPVAGRGQAAPTVRVNVRILDSSSTPIVGADVSIVRDVATVLANALTNDAGAVRLEVPRETGSLQLIVRKIGYQRGYRFFSLPGDDSTSVTLRLVRAVTTLAPVNVTATEDLRRRSYHLDADDIEHSSRTLLDGTDIFKLRPDMMTSRGGAQACAVPWTDHDGWVENVWVNGRHIVLPYVDSVYLAGRKASLGVSAPFVRPNPRLVPDRTPKPLPPPFTQFRHIDTVLSILRTIKPEHIAEVTYHDCFDSSVGKPRSDMAMFIVLKPGIGYDDAKGSYVVAEDSTRAHLSLLDTLPRYRFRLVGVFDAETGDVLPDVDVIDTLSGTSAKTTVTGTVSLFFMPEGERVVRMHRDGFADTTFHVTIAPHDTLPLTLILRRRQPPP